MKTARVGLLVLILLITLTAWAWAQSEAPATAPTEEAAPAAEAEPAAEAPPIAAPAEPVEPAAEPAEKPVAVVHPETVKANAVAAVHHQEAAHGEHAEEGHGGSDGDGHWTLFNLIPMEWTLPVAQTVAGWFGKTISPASYHMYNSHGLLHVMIMFFVLILITVFSVVVGGKYKRMLDDPAPRPGVSGQNLMEMVVQTVLGMMREIIGGHKPEQYLPLIGSLTFVILFNNLLGLIPGFYTATDNVNTNAAMALTVFLLYHYFGMKTHGVAKYLAHFMGPLEGKVKYIMAPLMIPIELISHLARPLSLSLRLFGNMFGDHKVFAVFMGLAALPIIYPLPFLALGLLVAIVQTLVFVLLSMVYIGLATAESH